MPDVYASEIIYEDGWLKIKAPEKQVKRLLNNLEPGWLKIAKREKPKTYEQIKLCWKLCELIAQKKSMIEKTPTTKMEIYRNAVADVGKWQMLGISNEAITDFAKEWSSRGDGWFIRFVEVGEEQSIINAYYGCSVYSTKEMTRLLEYLIEDAKALNIQVNTQELESLLRSA